MTSATPTKPYLIVGCDGDMQPRIEVREMMNHQPYQFSLFIQALSKMMTKGYTCDGTDAPSWQQIGGIHGLPTSQWSGDPKGPSTETEGSDWGGYCPHECVTFPTWHRVIMLLVEQAVFREAGRIAKTVCEQHPTEATEWVAAAGRIRFPFWDWSLPDETGMPDIFRSSSIEIVCPGGIKKSVPNPLESYTFEQTPQEMGFWPDVSQTGIYFSSWLRTYRWPTQSATPKQDYAAADTAFNKGDLTYQFPQPYPGTIMTTRPIQPHSWLRQTCGELFTYPATVPDDSWIGNIWDHFSNTGVSHIVPESPLPPGISPTIPSLEQPHNNVHTDIGGFGHMSWNEFAGFDPTFYLHHCNVDRIYALWEYCYPNYWMDKGYRDANGNNAQFTTPTGTFTEQQNMVINNQTPLTPFRKYNGEYWTSDDVRGLQAGQGVKKNYTYPAITVDGVTIRVDQPTTDADRAKYRAALQSYFGLDHGSARDQLPVAKARIFSPPSAGVPAGHEPLKNYRHFVVVCDIRQHAWGGSYRVELFLHAEPAIVVGSFSVLGRLRAEGCAKCVGRQAAQSEVRGHIFIPPMVILYLLEVNKLNHSQVSDDEVMNMLKTSFGARITSPDKQTLAESRPAQGGAGAVSGGAVDDAGIVPKLTFYSTAVSHPIGKPKGGVTYYGWKAHGTMLGESWKQAVASA